MQLKGLSGRQLVEELAAQGRVDPGGRAILEPRDFQL